MDEKGRIDELKHFGVKGMKWGIRKRIQAEISSSKRERSWKQQLKDISSMSDDDIKKTTERMRLENDLKRLTRNKKITDYTGFKDYKNHKKTRLEYLDRTNKTNEELKARVARLNLENQLRAQLKEATKEQRERGQAFVRSARNVGLGYARSSTKGSRVLINEILVEASASIDRKSKKHEKDILG